MSETQTSEVEVSWTAPTHHLDWYWAYRYRQYAEWSIFAEHERNLKDPKRLVVITGV